VRDLNLPVEIVVCPIVRESDGLAMSSRNAYLNPQERKTALVANRSLTETKNRFDQGERNAIALIAVGKQIVAQEPAARLDYFEIVDPVTLDPMQELTSPALVAVGVFIGNTRLIDNILLP
jgi:pantoate--beta-alanine ligase